MIDTNVLLFDPTAIKSFGDNEVVIPLSVLDELDAAKSRPDAIGRNARAVVRFLDALRSEGSLSQGVKFGEVTVRVELNHRNFVPAGLEPGKQDNRIISVAVGLKEGGKRVVLVSKDINMRVKCDALGIPAEDYYTDKVTDAPASVYSGKEVVEVESEVIDRLFRDGEIPNDFGGLPNQFFLLKASENHVGLGRVVGDQIKAVRKVDNIQGITPRNLEQRMAAELLLNPKIQLVTMIGKAGSGKAQPLDSKVLTPTGWTTIGELKIGDKVMCPDGKHSEVLSIHPQGIKEVYRVVFSDGTSTECCQEHLWAVKETQDRWKNRDWKVKSLKEIAENVIVHKSKKRNYSIPMVDKIDFEEEVELPMDPYLLGILIGDGGLTNQCSLSSADREIVGSVNNLLKKFNMKTSYRQKYDFYLVSKDATDIGPACMPILRINVSDGSKYKYDSIHKVVEDGFSKSGVYKACASGKLHKGFFWKYIPEDKPHSKNKLKNTLIKLGVYGKKSEKKFIPEIYKYTSFENRVKLIQGLMDTDGTVEGCETYLSTSSQKLRDDFKELCQSVGAKVTIQTKKNPKYTHKGESRESRLDNYIVRVSFPPHINPFKLSRKKNAYVPRSKYLPARFIDKIEYVGEKECVCIYIDHPNHLYITNDYIVTHNTLLAVAAGLQHVIGKGTNYNRMLISRPVQPMGRDLGYLPGNIEEKMDPWMQPLYDNLELLLGSDRHMLEMYKDQGLIQVEPLTYIRGRSIPKSLMIIDEAQNLMIEEIKTIITRVGEGTKIILTGDIDQIDVPHLDFADNGLTQAVERFKHYGIAGHITLQKCERSELAELGAKIL